MHSFLSPFSHSHPSDISSVRACAFESASDLLAIGGDSFCEILEEVPNTDGLEYSVFETVNIGARVTSIAWSPRSVSFVQSKEDWFIELAVAGDDGNIRHIMHSAHDETPTVSTFGSGTSGHRGKINDLCFCTAQDRSKYLASVGDDKNCIIWDLSPTPDEPSPPPSPTSFVNFAQRSTSRALSSPPAQPIAYPIPFLHPLHSVASHTENARSFMVSDSRGCVSVINWTEIEFDEIKLDRWRGHRVVELIDPSALSQSATGTIVSWGGGADWKQSDPNMFGATYGSKWVVWNQRKLQGGKPVISGEGFPEGGHRFRWCPTNPHLFAVSSQSPFPGATILVFDTNFPQAPRSFNILPKPHRVRDFDWIGTETQEDINGRAWMAVAVGKKIYFVAGGDIVE